MIILKWVGSVCSDLLGSICSGQLGSLSAGQVGSVSLNFTGGVRFKVNGLKHKGIVEISLRYVDDYTITFLSKTGEEIRKVEGVYCDMLVEILDWIEDK